MVISPLGAFAFIAHNGLFPLGKKMHFSFAQQLDCKHCGYLSVCHTQDYKQYFTVYNLESYYLLQYNLNTKRAKETVTTDDVRAHRPELGLKREKKAQAEQGRV